MDNNPAVSEHLSHEIVLYDGVCGLCNRLNQFLLKRDRHDRLRFAALQSGFATSVLRKHGLNPQDLDTVYVVIDPGKATERVVSRSDAILHAAQQLGGVWKATLVGKIVPRFIRDKFYDLVAANRYRMFGKSDTCMMPAPEHRAKFLDG